MQNEQQVQTQSESKRKMEQTAQVIFFTGFGNFQAFQQV